VRAVIVFSVSMMAAQVQTQADLLSVTAQNDRPATVDIRVDAKDVQGAVLLSSVLSWGADDNSYSAETLTIPSDTRILRFTFLNDSFICCDPDDDRNAFIDFFSVDGRVTEAENFDETGGTDPSFPGCEITVIDTRTVAACGNRNDYVEYRPGTTLINHGFTYSVISPDEWCGGDCDPTDPNFPCLGGLPGDCIDWTDPPCCSGGPCPSPPAPSDWLFTMAEAIRARTSNNEPCLSRGTILEYKPCTGEWAKHCGSEDERDDVVLIFNWRQESDGINQGGTFGFVEGAADALYAALRDPWLPGGLTSLDLFEGRDVQFIGHSRGTAVNSEAAERLAAAGIEVDQVTTLDPHPVDGTPPPDWGDPEPTIWDNVEWADNYWRDDLNPLDFNGQTVAGSYDRNLECVLPESEFTLEHSKVHSWYHGTVDAVALDDGAGTAIPASWYDNTDPGCDAIPRRDRTGYFFATGLGAGSRPDSPNQQPRTAATYSPALVYNGNFEIVDLLQLGHAGWRYHGGDVEGVIPWTTDLMDRYASLTLIRPTLTHNRLFVHDKVNALLLRRRRLPLPPTTNDEFRVVLVEALPPHTETILGTQSVSGMSTAWETVRFCIAQSLREKAYTLRVEVIDPVGGLVESTVDVDDIRFRTDGGVQLQLEVNPILLQWLFPACGPGLFDIVRGDVEILRGSGGDYTIATQECLANDIDEDFLPLFEDPAFGEGHWFLVRSSIPGEIDTYDTGEASQVASRDPGIEASPFSCP
jgi:hypothetical protein